MGSALGAALVAMVTAVLGYLDKLRLEAKAAREHDELGRLRNESEANKVGDEIADSSLPDLMRVLRFDASKRRLKLRRPKNEGRSEGRKVSDILDAQRKRDETRGKD